MGPDQARALEHMRKLVRFNPDDQWRKACTFFWSHELFPSFFMFASNNEKMLTGIKYRAAKKKTGVARAMNDGLHQLSVSISVTSIVVCSGGRTRHPTPQ